MKIADDPTFFQHCKSFVQSSIQYAANNKFVKTVVVSGLWQGPLVNIKEKYVDAEGQNKFHDGGDHLMQQGLADTVALLKKSGKRVIVVDDVPFWDFDPLKIWINRQMRFRSMFSALASRDQSLIDGDFGTSNVNERSRNLVLKASTSQDADILYTRNVLCRDNAHRICQFVKDNQLLYLDSSHVSLDGASLIGNYYAKYIFN